MWRGLAAVPIAIAAGIAAIPVAGYAGLTLTTAFDRDARAGLGMEVADGLVSTSFAFVMFAPVVVALGLGATALVGVRSVLLRLVAPLALIALLAIPAALLVRMLAPDPGPIRRADEPVLAQIAPLAGARSGHTATVNESYEWESIDWVTQRVDVLPAETPTSVAVRHYRAALRQAGWKIDDVLGAGSEEVVVFGLRDGRRLKVAISGGIAPRVRLELR